MSKRVLCVMTVAALVLSPALAGCGPSAQEQAKADAELKAARVAYLRISKPINDYSDQTAGVRPADLAGARKRCQTWSVLLANEMLGLSDYKWPTPRVAALVETRIAEAAKRRSVFSGCTSADSKDDYNRTIAELNNLPPTGTADLIRLELKLPPVPATTPSSTTTSNP